MKKIFPLIALCILPCLHAQQVMTVQNNGASQGTINTPGINNYFWNGATVNFTGSNVIGLPFPTTGYVGQIVAGTNITISPPGGQGTVTINSSGATPGGPTDSIQYNNGSGGLSGNAALYWTTGPLGLVFSESGVSPETGFTNINANTSSATASIAYNIEGGTSVGNWVMTGDAYSGAFLTGGQSGKSMNFYTVGAIPLVFGTNNAANLTILSGGAATFSSTLTTTGELFTTATTSRAALNVGSFAGSPSTLNNGDMWYNSTANQLDARINGVTVSIGNGTGGNGSANILAVTQTQSFTLGECLYDSGGTWTPSDNTLSTSAHIDGVVIVTGPSSFTVCLGGYENAVTGLAANTQYYLGTSGALTSTAPTGLTTWTTYVLKTGVAGDGFVEIGSPTPNSLIPVASGGTGISSVTAGSILIGNGSSPFTAYSTFDAINGSNVGIGATAVLIDGLKIGSALSGANAASNTILLSGSQTSSSASANMVGFNESEVFTRGSTTQSAFGMNISDTVTVGGLNDILYTGLTVQTPSLIGSSLNGGWMVNIQAPATGMTGAINVQGGLVQLAGGTTITGGLTADTATVSGTLTSTAAMTVSAGLTNATGETGIVVNPAFTSSANSQIYSGMTITGSFIGGSFTGGDMYGLQILTPTNPTGTIAGGYMLNIGAPATGMTGAINVASGIAAFGGEVTTTATSTLPAILIGSTATQPGTLVNGAMWYDSTGGHLDAYIAGAVVNLGSGGGGSGTVTHTTGALTSNYMVIGNGSADVKVAAGFTTDGTSVLTLGQAGTSVGGLALANATSGTITLNPPTGALGSVIVTIPDATDTLVNLAGTQSLTNKTYNGTTWSSSTGTGLLVLQTSPTFVTPVLGAATGTSVSITGTYASTAGTGTNAFTHSLNSNGAGLGAQWENANAGTSTTEKIGIYNGTNFLDMAMTGTGYTGSIITNAPTSTSGAIWTTGAIPLIFGTNSTLALTLAVGGAATFASSVTTAAGATHAAGAWKMGALRTGTALTFSTTQVIEIDVGGTLYDLMVCSTNP